MSRDQAGMGGTPGGAISKGDGGRMSKSAERSLRRGIILDIADPLEAFRKAAGSKFETVNGELRMMSAESLRSVMATNPTLLGEAGKTWCRDAFNKSGMGHELDVLSKGAAREHNDRVSAEIKAFLISKPLSERTPDELGFLADKFGELGVSIGKEPEALNSAIGGFLSSTPSLEQMMKGGRKADAAPKLQ